MVKTTYSIWSKQPKWPLELQSKLIDAVQAIVAWDTDHGLPDVECFDSCCQSARFWRDALAGTRVWVKDGEEASQRRQHDS